MLSQLGPRKPAQLSLQLAHTEHVAADGAALLLPIGVFAAFGTKKRGILASEDSCFALASSRLRHREASSIRVSRSESSAVRSSRALAFATTYACSVATAEAAIAGRRQVSH